MLSIMWLPGGNYEHAIASNSAVVTVGLTVDNRVLPITESRGVLCTSGQAAVSIPWTEQAYTVEDVGFTYYVAHLVPFMSNGKLQLKAVLLALQLAV